MKHIRVALAAFLRPCPYVVTIGVRSCLDDYSDEEKVLMRSARRVFFPSIRYVDIFQALDIPTFPNPSTYRYLRSRISQQLLFQYLGLPRPRARIYFGREKRNILSEFGLPLILLGPRTVPGTSHFVSDIEVLEEYTNRYNPVIIQEFVEWKEQIRVICVNFECIAAFRRSATMALGPFFEPIEFDHPYIKKLEATTVQFLHEARLDDILIEWGHAKGTWQIIEMTRPPSKWYGTAGLVRRYTHICKLIGQGLL